MPALRRVIRTDIPETCLAEKNPRNVRADRPQCIPGVAAVQRSCPGQVFMASQTDADAQIGRLIAGLEQHGIAGRSLL